MTFYLSSAWPLANEMLTNCQVEPKGKTLVKFESKCLSFHSRNIFENIICRKILHFAAALICKAVCRIADDNADFQLHLVFFK